MINLKKRGDWLHWFKLLSIATGLFLVVLAFQSWSWGEKVNLNEGMGWDGVIYAGMIKTGIFMELSARLIDTFCLQRTLPSVIISIVFYVFKILPSAEHIVKAFVVFDSVALSGAIFYFFKLGQLLKLNRQQFIFAVSFVFLNYFGLKFLNYYPVLTDHFAFFLGLAIAYSYYANKSIQLAFFMLLSAFTWPSGFLCALFLLLFPRGSSIRFDAQTLFPWFSRIAYFALLLFVFGMVDFFKIRAQSTPVYSTQIHVQWMFISLAVLFAYLHFVLNAFVDNFKSPDHTKFRYPSQRANLIAFAVIMLIRKYIFYAFGPVEVKEYFANYLSYMFNQSIVEPAYFLVGHLIFWGPAFIFLIFGIRPLFKSLKDDGVGIQLFILSTFFFMISSESRHHIFHVPMLGLLLARALKWSQKFNTHVWILAAVQLFSSRFWFSIGVDWNKPTGNLLDFPWQRYFMNLGPWISPKIYEPAYLILSLSSVLFFVFIYHKLVNVSQSYRSPVEQIG